MDASDLSRQGPDPSATSQQQDQELKNVSARQPANIKSAVNVMDQPPCFEQKDHTSMVKSKDDANETPMLVGRVTNEKETSGPGEKATERLAAKNVSLATEDANVSSATSTAKSACLNQGLQGPRCPSFDNPSLRDDLVNSGHDSAIAAPPIEQTPESQNMVEPKVSTVIDTISLTEHQQKTQSSSSSKSFSIRAILGRSLDSSSPSPEPPANQMTFPHPGPSGVIEITPDVDSEDHARYAVQEPIARTQSSSDENADSFIDVETVSEETNTIPTITADVTNPPEQWASPSFDAHSEQESEVDIDALSDDELGVPDNDSQIIELIMRDIVDWICFQENTKIKQEKLGGPTTPGIGKLRAPDTGSGKKRRHLKTEREAEIEAIMAKDKLKYEGWATEVDDSGPRRRNQLPQKSEPCKCDAPVKGSLGKKGEHYHCSQCDLTTSWANIIRHEATIHRILRPGLVTYTCPVCHYIVIHVSEYARHIAGHFFGQQEKIDDKAKAFLQVELEKCVALGVKIRQKPAQLSPQEIEIYRRAKIKSKKLPAKFRERVKGIAEKTKKTSVKKRPPVAKLLAQKARKVFQKTKTKPKVKTPKKKAVCVPPGKSYRYQVTLKGEVEETVTNCVNVHPEAVPARDGLYHCQKCPFQASGTGSIKRHYVAIHGMRASSTFQCHLCKVFTTNKFDFHRHMKAGRHVEAVATAKAKHAKSPSAKKKSPASVKQNPSKGEETKTKTSPPSKSPVQKLKPNVQAADKNESKVKLKNESIDSTKVALGTKTLSSTSCPLKSFAQFIPMKPSEFARSHFGRLSQSKGRRSPKIPALDGAQDTESGDESIVGEQDTQETHNENSPQNPTTGAQACPVGEAEQGGGVSVSSDDPNPAPVEGENIVKDEKRDEGDAEMDIQEETMAAMVQETVDRPVVKIENVVSDECVEPHRLPTCEEDWLVPTVKEEIVNLGPIEGETFPLPTEQPELVPQIVAISGRSPATYQEWVQCEEQLGWKAVVPLHRNPKLEHISHQLRRKPGYIYVVPALGGYDFICLSKRPSSGDTLRNLSPVPMLGVASDSDGASTSSESGQFSSVITKSGSWGVAVESLGQNRDVSVARKMTGPSKPVRCVARKSTGASWRKVTDGASSVEVNSGAPKKAPGKTLPKGGKKSDKKSVTGVTNPRNTGQAKSTSKTPDKSTGQSKQASASKKAKSVKKKSSGKAKKTSVKETDPKDTSPDRSSVKTPAKPIVRGSSSSKKKSKRKGGAKPARPGLRHSSRIPMLPSDTPVDLLPDSAEEPVVEMKDSPEPEDQHCADTQPVISMSLAPQPDPASVITIEPDSVRYGEEGLEAENTMVSESSVYGKRKSIDAEDEELCVVSVALAKKKVKSEPVDIPLPPRSLLSQFQVGSLDGPLQLRSGTRLRGSVELSQPQPRRSAFHSTRPTDRGYARDLVPPGSGSSQGFSPLQNLQHSFNEQRVVPQVHGQQFQNQRPFLSQDPVISQMEAQPSQQLHTTAYPGYPGQQVAPGYPGQQMAPGYSGQQGAPGYLGHQGAPGFLGQQEAPGYLGQPVAPGYNPGQVPGYADPSSTGFLDNLSGLGQDYSNTRARPVHLIQHQTQAILSQAQTLPSSAGRPIDLLSAPHPILSQAGPRLQPANLQVVAPQPQVQPTADRPVLVQPVTAAVATTTSTNHEQQQQVVTQVQSHIPPQLSTQVVFAPSNTQATSVASTRASPIDIVQRTEAQTVVAGMPAQTPALTQPQTQVVQTTASTQVAPVTAQTQPQLATAPVASTAASVETVVVQQPVRAPTVTLCVPSTTTLNLQAPTSHIQTEPKSASCTVQTVTSSDKLAGLTLHIASPSKQQAVAGPLQELAALTPQVTTSTPKDNSVTVTVPSEETAPESSPAKNTTPQETPPKVTQPSVTSSATSKAHQDVSIFNLKPVLSLHPQLNPASAYPIQALQPSTFLGKNAMFVPLGSPTRARFPVAFRPGRGVTTIAMPKSKPPAISITVDDDDDVLIVNDPLVPKPKQLPPRRTTPQKNRPVQATTPQKQRGEKPQAFVSPVKNIQRVTPQKTPKKPAAPSTSVIDLTDEPRAGKPSVEPPAASAAAVRTSAIPGNSSQSSESVVDLTSGETPAGAVERTETDTRNPPSAETVTEPETESSAGTVTTVETPQESTQQEPPQTQTKPQTPLETPTMVERPVLTFPGLNLEDLDSVSSEDLWKELLDRKLLVQCVCGQAFKNNTLYYIHRQSHNTDDPMRCGACSNKVDNWCAFMAHLLDHKK